MDTALEERKEQLKRAAWTHGNLDYLVRPYQEEIWSILTVFVGLEDIHIKEKATSTAVALARQKKSITLNIARRFGKSSVSLLMLIILCIRNPEHTYLFVAPTDEQATEIISSVLPKLLMDCPTHLRPDISKNSIRFNNGSRIRIGSTWNGADAIRGGSANGIVIDEAAHIPQHNPTSCLSYVLGSVLRPMLSDTDGFTIIASTPPRSLQHDLVHIIRNADKEGTLITRDVYANKGFTPERIAREKEESYNIDPSGSAWKREYLVLLVPDANDLVIPEDVTDGIELIRVHNDDFEGFEHLDRYISFDHGTKDLNVILFAFHDYANARTVIQRELVIKGSASTTTDVIAKEIARVKKELWGHLPVFRSICDAISKQLIVDLNAHEAIKKAGIVFLNPQKTDLEAMVNQLIISMSHQRFVIDDGCDLLLETLRTGTWKTSDSTGKREFARLGAIGHCDALACLVYLQRALNKSNNPFAGKKIIDVQNVMITPRDLEPQTQGIGVLSKALSGPNRKGFHTK